MGLNPKLVEGLKLMGIKDPTPIQAKCIPELKAGRDLIGLSLTGSGKTAAFGLPILEKIIPGNGIQALIITPTRELCVQDRDSLESMAKFLPINIKCVYGGVGFYQQIEDLKIAEIIVATPGRLLDHVGRRNVDLRGIKFVVLDEADRMFDMGFEDDIEKIMRLTPTSRQTIMFSATMPKAAQALANKYLKNPVTIQEKMHVDKSLLKQVFYSVRKEEKFSLLVHLLKTKTSGPAIVFCGTKREVDRIARNLKKQNIASMPVHGDLAQGRRQFAVNAFKDSKIDVLVATDVAARGLDIKNVSHVYNYDVPRTTEEYTHRIGRTARAGKKGDAVTLVTERDYSNFNRLLRSGKHEILQETVPEFAEVEFKKDSFGEEHERSERRGFGERRDFGHGRNPRASFSDRPTHGQHSRPFQSQGRAPQAEQNSSYSSERPYTPRQSYAPRENYSSRPAYNSQPRDNYSAQSRDNYSRPRNSFSSGPRTNYPSQRSNYSDRPQHSYNSAPRNNYSAQPRDNYSSQPRNNFSSKNSYNSKPRGTYNFDSAPIKRYEDTSRGAAPAVVGGHEKTPRTPEPLFPESHYNPEYQKHKAPKASAPVEKSEGTHEKSFSSDKPKSFSHDKKPHAKEGKTPFYASSKFHKKKRF